MPDAKSKQRSMGFTLVELLVVIGIVGLILGLAIPAVNLARSASYRVSCANNLKQLALAMHTFHGTYSCFPSGRGSGGPPNLPGIGWQAPLLPYLEQESLWLQTVEANKLQPLIVPSAIAEDPPRHEVPRDPPHIGMGSVVPASICPADSRLKTPLNTPKQNKIAFSSYLGLSQVRAEEFDVPASMYHPGIFGDDHGCRMSDVLDGTSHTLFFGERPPPASLQAGPWYSTLLIDFPGGPNQLLEIPQVPYTMQDPCGNISKSQALGPGNLQNPCDRNHFWSLHGGGAHFATADGGVRWISYGNKRLVPAMATIAGGENLD